MKAFCARRVCEHRLVTEWVAVENKVPVGLVKDFPEKSCAWAEVDRGTTRVPLNTKVTCTLESRTRLGVTWNISQGGIQLEVSGLQRGDTIRMSFLLPQPAAAIKAQGVVVWAQEERQGLYLTEMSTEDQEGGPG